MVPVSVSADGSKGVKPGPAKSSISKMCRFSIRRWIEGCEARAAAGAGLVGDGFQYPQMDSKGVKQHMLARHLKSKNVSVSADGSKGVKLGDNSASKANILCFSIRRWIEGCEALALMMKLF